MAVAREEHEEEHVPRGVSEEEAIVLTHGLGEAFRTLVHEHVAPAAGRGVVLREERRAGGGDGRGDLLGDRDLGQQGGVGAEGGGVAVDGNVGEVTDKLLDAADLELVGLRGGGQVPAQGR